MKFNKKKFLDILINYYIPSKFNSWKKCLRSWRKVYTFDDVMYLLISKSRFTLKKRNYLIKFNEDGEELPNTNR